MSSPPDDEYARAWKKAVDAAKPQQRRNLVANVAAGLAAFVAFVAALALVAWVHSIIPGRRSRGGLVSAGFVFMASAIAFAGVRALLGHKE